jgi:hypothetical protein
MGSIINVIIRNILKIIMVSILKESLVLVKFISFTSVKLWTRLINCIQLVKNMLMFFIIKGRMRREKKLIVLWIILIKFISKWLYN